MFDEEAARITSDWLRATSTKRMQPPTPYRLTRSGHFQFQVLGIGLAAFAALVLTVMTAGMRPAWDAHFGHGTRGKFTVVSTQCSKSCTYRGIFTDPFDNHRTDMKLSNPPHLKDGDWTYAIDSGGYDNVYPDDGGNTWALVCVGQGLAGAALAYSVSKVANNRVRRRWEAKTARTAKAAASAG